MAKTARLAASAVLVMAVLGCTSSAAATGFGEQGADQPSITASHARVRGVGPRLAAILIEAATQSKTFRGLIEQIDATNGIVYVAEGRCEHGRRSCLLLTMTLSGENRFLRILVDPRNSDRDLMATIGHELQHAIEVLSDPTVTSSSRMLLFYLRLCQSCGGGSGPFETDAAVMSGRAVQKELTESTRSPSARRSAR